MTAQRSSRLNVDVEKVVEWTEGGRRKARHAGIERIDEVALVGDDCGRVGVDLALKPAREHSPLLGVVRAVIGVNLLIDGMIAVARLVEAVRRRIRAAEV